MYGTIARMRVKPGMEDRLMALSNNQAANPAPGQVATYVYRMDSNPNEFFLVVMFESREAYRANAESQEQHQSYLEYMQFMDGEPEWHDGEIVWSSQ
jgi:heme-degrading monooxygenase HmoA